MDHNDHIADQCSLIAAGVTNWQEQEDVRMIAENVIQQRDAAARKIIQDLVDAIGTWGECDPIHPVAWVTYCAARQYLEPGWYPSVCADCGRGFVPPADDITAALCEPCEWDARARETAG